MINATARRAPTAQEANLLCARLPFINRNDVTALQRAAFALGMQQVGTNAYQHPSDGSWAYMDAQGVVQRGVGNTLFQGIPGGQRAAPAPAARPAPVAPPMAPAVTRSSALPPVPASMKSYKIAQIGIQTVATAPTVCAQHGYVQSGSDWVHSDGSWLSTANGRVTVGWHGHPLSALPYQNGSGWR